MKQLRLIYPLFAILLGVLTLATGFAQQGGMEQVDIFSGFYSREDNYGKEAQASGHSQYIKFYPKNRIIRLYIPFPYSKTVMPDAINTAFAVAAGKTPGNAYIRDKFNVMQELVVAHLDTFRWVEGQVMYDCGNAAPCRVSFNDDVMTILQPGVVMNHEIRYRLVNTP